MNTLSRYLTTSGTTQRELAAKISRSPSYVNELKQGTKTPSMGVARAIEVATGGAVPMSSWAERAKPAARAS